MCYNEAKMNQHNYCALHNSCPPSTGGGSSSVVFESIQLDYWKTRQGHDKNFRATSYHAIDMDPMQVATAEAWI